MPGPDQVPAKLRPARTTPGRQLVVADVDRGLRRDDDGAGSQGISRHTNMHIRLFRAKLAQPRAPYATYERKT